MSDRQFWWVLLLATSLTAAAVLGLQAPAVREVTPQVAKSLMDTGAVVIDVRGESQYKVRHLPNAILIPLEQLRSGVPAELKDMKDRRMIIYCGDGVWQGPESVRLLVRAGFRYAVNLEQGVQGWLDAGYAMNKA